MASLCVCQFFLYMCVCFEGFLYVQLRKCEKGQLEPGLGLERVIATEEGKEIENLSSRAPRFENGPAPLGALKCTLLHIKCTTFCKFVGRGKEKGKGES